MAIKVQGRIFAKGKSFWTSGGGTRLPVDPPTSTETFAIALEDGGIITVEDGAGGYVATEDAPANGGGNDTGGGTPPTENPTPVGPPADAVTAQDGSSIMAQNGTDYISF